MQTDNRWNEFIETFFRADLIEEYYFAIWEGIQVTCYIAISVVFYYLRKINVNNAINNPFVARYERGYYYTEDHISVAKYYPWQPIDLLDKSVNTTGTDPFKSTMKDVVSPLLPDESTVNPDYDPAWSGDTEYL